MITLNHSSVVVALLMLITSSLMVLQASNLMVSLKEDQRGHNKGNGNDLRMIIIPMWTTLIPPQNVESQKIDLYIL